MKHLEWKDNPIILEINTVPWLEFLLNDGHEEKTLEFVPGDFFQSIKGKYDAVWLMGVWSRSPESAMIAKEHEGLQQEFLEILPDLQPEDIIGSPYSIHEYTISDLVGGERGLISFREELADIDMNLVLDFVPNHVGIDHPWLDRCPGCLITGNERAAREHPEWFFQKNEVHFAHGRDPYFPPWTDTVQVNAFSTEYREQACKVLDSIASLCDGVRCDMAMLLMDNVFTRTWGDLAGSPRDTPFWKKIIGWMKQEHPGFKFIAEVYWDMEWELQQQGFHFCYDKRLYDRLRHGQVEEIRAHLKAPLAYQQKLIRFTENHDEARAVKAFGDEKSLAAMGITASLPGACLIHQGQDLGWKRKVPVHLRRFPAEEINTRVQDFHGWLLETLKKAGIGLSMRESNWRLLDIQGNHASTCILHLWVHGSNHAIITTNYSSRQVSLSLSLDDIIDTPVLEPLDGKDSWWVSEIDPNGKSTFMIDQDTGASFLVDLPAWATKIISIKPASE